MKLKTIAALSIPAFLLACGGNDGGVADITEARGAPERGTPVSTRAPSTTSSGAVPGSQQVDARQVLQAQVAGAALTLDDATDVALAANPGSQVLEADLDGSGATLRYEIELRLADGSVVEVHVDANTGNLVASFPEDADDDDDDDDDDGPDDDDDGND